MKQTRMLSRRLSARAMASFSSEAINAVASASAVAHRGAMTVAESNDVVCE